MRPRLRLRPHSLRPFRTGFFLVGPGFGLPGWVLCWGCALLGSGACAGAGLALGTGLGWGRLGASGFQARASEPLAFARPDRLGNFLSFFLIVINKPCVVYLTCPRPGKAYPYLSDAFLFRRALSFL